MENNYITMFLELILSIDYIVHDWFNAVRSDSLTTFFNSVTMLGNWQFVIPCAAVVVAVLYFYNKRRYITPFMCVLINGEVITHVLKVLVARPRALDALVTKNDFSFPSGHAMIAIALYGFLIYMGRRHIKTVWIRRIAMLALTILILLIGLSRLYLGVHYVSDVLAGYLIGGAALFVCTHFLIPYREKVQ